MRKRQARRQAVGQGRTKGGTRGSPSCHPPIVLPPVPCSPSGEDGGRKGKDRQPVVCRRQAVRRSASQPDCYGKVPLAGVGFRLLRTGCSGAVMLSCLSGGKAARPAPAGQIKRIGMPYAWLCVFLPHLLHRHPLTFALTAAHFPPTTHRVSPVPACPPPIRSPAGALKQKKAAPKRTAFLLCVYATVTA